MHCGIYIRKSRKERDKGDVKAISHRLTLQREELPEFARAQGWTYEVYDDGYASAARGKIEDLKERARLEADIRAGKINVILCIELERLSRDDTAEDYFRWLSMCKQFGVKLATPTKTTDPACTDEWVLSGITGILSSAEMQRLKTRMDEGYTKLVKDGKWLGGIPPAPYVYDYANSRPIIDQEKLPMMKQLWSLATEFSAKAVAEKLGLPEIFVRRSISDARLLIYQAKRVNPPDGSVIDCDWEACLDEETANKIIAARRTRRNLKGRKAPYASLLSAMGILRCAYCGSTAKVWQGKTNKDGRRTDYYGCQKKNGRTCPQSQMVKQSILNELVVTNLLHTLNDIEQLKKYWLENQRESDPRKRLDELSKAEKKEEEKKRRLVQAVGEGHLEFADIKPEMAKITAKITEIQMEREEINRQQTEMPDLDALSVTPADWHEFDTDDRRALILAAIERIDLYNSYAIITYRFPRHTSGDCTSRIKLPPQIKPKKKL